MAFKWFKKEPQAHPEHVEAQSTPGSQPTGVSASDAPSAPASGTDGFFQRLKKGLAKTRRILTTDIDDLFAGRKTVDDDLLADLEELLITSDIGVETTMELIASIRAKAGRISTPAQLKEVLKDQIRIFLATAAPAFPAPVSGPRVIMVVGVNGVGKTTTIGKLASRFSAEGKTVLIAAADTFRAAAIDQLAIWATRAGVELIRHKDNADPAAVAYDAVDAAVARRMDIVLVDTAGRLHTKVNLMEELKKIKRTLSKRIPEAPHEVLLVLDATTGQNALSQARLFDEAVSVTGMALTKLDGTAKGGIVVSICRGLDIPLQYIGVGESIEDLQIFDPVGFVDALFQ
jgi:fused signal recognition particle receptor